MGGRGSKDQTASTRSAEPPRPVRQTRQALKAQREAEAEAAINVAADEPAASLQPTHDEVEVAARDSATVERFSPAARRFMRETKSDEPFTSPASTDFDDNTTELIAPTPGRLSFFPPNRPPRESVGSQPRDSLRGRPRDSLRGRPRESVGGRPRDPVGGQRSQGVIYPLAAAAQQDDANQEDEDEYQSSSSESEKPIQRRPTGPRRTHFDDAHDSNEMTIGVVTGLEHHPRAKEVRPWTDNSGIALSHYQRGNQNPSDYLEGARRSLQMPGTPKEPNQSPRKDALRGFSQANMLKRQRTIDEREEDENEDEEDVFETNNRPAKQRVTERETKEKLDSSRGFVAPPPQQSVVNGRPESVNSTESSHGPRANASEHEGAVKAAAHSRGSVPPASESVANGRQGSASRTESVNGDEDNYSEDNKAAVARLRNDGLDKNDILELNARVREKTANSRRATRQPQKRSAWPTDDTLKLIAAISEKGCSWSELENVLLTLSTPRNQQQIRDKARNVKVDFLLADEPLPHGFDGIALGKKERERVIFYKKNPDREEADVDDNGKPINCDYAR